LFISVKGEGRNMQKANQKLVKSSYSIDDVVFLLKDLSHVTIEKSTEERENAIQTGTHYSEMLPIEYEPTDEYLELFHQSLLQYKNKVATCVGVVAEQIIDEKGKDIVLVSLARAGTPVGILIKRYIKEMLGITIPHYSVSIIRGKGLDLNAISHILSKHPNKRIVFVDGWTGKGAITKELYKSIDSFFEQYGFQLDGDLAVLADPGHCSTLFGTREDFLIPNACLNSTVSGLVSRTILNDELIAEKDFHGAKYYSNLENRDVSLLYIETITQQFSKMKQEIVEQKSLLNRQDNSSTWKGLKDIVNIQQHYGLEDINLIKPGVGETTRVLLRRVPWKILVKDKKDPRLNHIYLLAKERGIVLEEYPDMSYTCCGLIRPLEKHL
jgi:hypothetical protein